MTSTDVPPRDEPGHSVESGLIWVPSKSGPELKKAALVTAMPNLTLSSDLACIAFLSLDLSLYRPRSKHWRRRA